MPASCANALRPTTALFGCGQMPVIEDSSRLARVSSSALMPLCSAQPLATHAQRHHQLLERRVARPLADAVDGHLHLPGARAHRRQRVRDRQPEVVVAVGGKRQAGHVVAQAAEDRAQLVRQRVADGVGHVEDGRARLVDGLRDLPQEGILRAGRVLGGELDVVGRRPGEAHRVRGLAQGLRRADLELVLEVDRRRGQEDVKARARGRLQRAGRGRDVLLLRACQCGHAARADLGGHAADRLQLGLRSHREAGLDDVDAQPLELAREAHLLVRSHRAAGRLLAVAEGRVEDGDASAQGTASTGAAAGRSSPSAVTVSGSRNGIRARRRSPTCSIGCARSSFRRAWNQNAPDSLSATHFFA